MCIDDTGGHVDAGPDRPGRAPPTPDYPDEITPERLAAIQALVDASRDPGQTLTPIGRPGW